MLAPLNISHAACKGHAPENTLAGIAQALALGVEAIEIDVHATRDGVPVLLHDDTVDRITDGTGRENDLTLAQLKALDAGGVTFDGRFAGERVPTLAEALEATRRRCLLVIEIKQRGIEQAVLSIVRRANAAASTMIWSFHAEVVSAARVLAPEVPAVQLWTGKTEAAASVIAGAVRRNAQGISAHHSVVDAGLIHSARLRGLSIFTWTADEPADQARVAAAGVDGICTNYPDVLRATLKKARYDGPELPRGLAGRGASRQRGDTLAG